MPPNDNAEHHHHLRGLRRAVDAINGQATRTGRVAWLRDHYDGAAAGYAYLERAIPRVVGNAARQRWVEQPRTVLERYAAAEGV
jgi:hypothetical protein